MPRKTPRVEEADENNLEVGKPKDWAAGLPGVYHSMKPAIEKMGVERSRKTLLALNQKDGFDCMSCAWPDPGHRKTFEFCENGAKAVTWEATPVLVPAEFWAEHPVSELRGMSEYWLGMQGRLTEPVYKPAGEDHYRPVSWDEAFSILGGKLKSLASPDEAAFYTSGRTSNEAAFLYQLFVRAYGTNNLPDCSNMCHESSGWGMGQTIGIGKATISYDDFAQADLIIIMGQNPGTNHPRMLTALEEAKEAGGEIVAVNPLPEAGLRRYKNPQKVKGIVGHGTQIADQFLQIRLGGDMALLQAVSKRVLDAEARNPGSVLDHQFLQEHCQGLEELKEHLAELDEREVLEATGLRREEIDELAERYLRAEKVIITWAMGITQHKKGVATIKEIINLLLLRGNMGKPGAGASPIRGHSNVQGDRTMGIWEQMPPAFLDALGKEFNFDPPREHGADAVETIRRMRDGGIKVFVGLGGNLVGAISDSQAAEGAMENTEMTVQISTKLNRSHTVTGKEALILPTMGRTEIDMQASGPQFVSVEDTVCAVHASHGTVRPVAPDLLSEVAIISRLARATLDGKTDADWAGFERDYDLIRDHISHVVAGCEDYNRKIRQKGGFVLPNGPRDSRTFPTPTGKAMLTVNHLEHVERPAGTLILQSMRSHDQFNTTIYGHDDRYRGIKKGRDVVFVSPEDIAELGLSDGQHVDIHGVYEDNVKRVLRKFRVVSYPTARGCAAAYYPEANVLVPLESVAEGSNTPVSKAVIVRLEPSTT
ncbi:formate dehydrogenase major subunit [Arthrobacter sp. PvP102]|jgi:formate dehydrogenase major subunit|uniref:FdhF/YdeP family oxidoreductase n=1 Tax=unclassified Arthrobacter TaxID=235627 RepID=UPI001AE12C42|nr:MULTISPECIES: FdhF/YdeP family oxidoreductase [unclassified Arthrobacter]MBP1234430.1 formate dehydrogenase major subunit [Arthrobacter sp. PvP103]MBP1239564.1 formate dehydrogenase major subunit [Arthrobacter sp. PvP102]